jgi:hypothetical protein
MRHRPQVLKADLEVLPGIATNDARLLGRLEQSEQAMMAALERGLDHWILAFSGGKDSTATAIVALEAALTSGGVRRVDLVYADTGLEIPTLQAFAMRFLALCRSCRGSRASTSMSTSSSPNRKTATGYYSSGEAIRRLISDFAGVRVA